MRFFIFFLPWLELFTLIKLGVETSALTALGYVFLTFVLGLMLLRRQGQGLFEKLREAQDGRMVGTQWLVDDMAAGFAGLLLMVPGLITDALAVLVVIGPLRRGVMRSIRPVPPQAQKSTREGHQPEIIEGTFHRIDDD